MANIAVLRTTSAASMAAPASEKVELPYQYLNFKFFCHCFICLFDYSCSCVADRNRDYGFVQWRCVRVSKRCDLLWNSRRHVGMLPHPRGTQRLILSPTQTAVFMLTRLRTGSEIVTEWTVKWCLCISVLTSSCRPFIVSYPARTRPLWLCCLHRLCAAMISCTAAPRAQRVTSNTWSAFLRLKEPRRCGTSSLPGWEQTGRTRKVSPGVRVAFKVPPSNTKRKRKHL